MKRLLMILGLLIVSAAVLWGGNATASEELFSDNASHIDQIATGIDNGSFAEAPEVAILRIGNGSDSPRFSISKALTAKKYRRLGRVNTAAFHRLE